MLKCLFAAAILGLPLAAQAAPRLVNLTDSPLTVTLRYGDGTRVLTLSPHTSFSAESGSPAGVSLVIRNGVGAAVVQRMLADEGTYWLDNDRSGALNIREAGHDFEAAHAARAIASR